MKIKNAVIPLLLCAAMVFFFLFIPENVSKLFDHAAMGKTVVSRQKEQPAQNLSLQETIELISGYGKNKGIVCMEEDYFMPSQMQAAESDEFGKERKKPGEELLGKVEAELDKLRQMALLPETDVKPEHSETDSFLSRRYIDMENDSRYVSVVKLAFVYDDMRLNISYDVLNEKLLACNIDVPVGTENFADRADILKKWSEYLGVTQEVAEKYYIIEADRNEKRAWMTIALKNE